MAGCPRRNARAPSIMGEAYKLILDALVARGWSAPRRRSASASRNCSG